MRYLSGVFIGLVFFAAELRSAEPGAASDSAFKVMSDVDWPVPPAELFRDHLRQQVQAASEERRERYEAVRTAADARGYQQRLKKFFIEQIGGLPERTPLNARVVERLSRPGYRVEKVVFESLPGFHVPSLLYLPDAEPPYPAVLMPCGHSDIGKAAEAYQRACILLARNGLAVLCFDPIGQGERNQLLDENGRPRFGPTSEHMVTGAGPIPLGRSLATYMIWDGMRAIDYLVSRDDIDSQRIGCTGNSGGGNLTAFLMALDERIVAAAPSCFITTHRRKVYRPGPGDAEQNIHGQIAFGMEHADFLTMRAPRPTLICAATRDYVPIEGAWEAFREAKRFYGRLGYPERVELAEADAPHGFSPLLRRAAALWMGRWLLDQSDFDEEVDLPILSANEARCTPRGQVLRLPGSRSIFDLNREKETELRAKREQLWQADPRGALEEMRRLAGVPRFRDLESPGIKRLGSVKREGYRVDRLILEPPGGVPLPALWFVPSEGTSEVVLYVHGEGKHVDAGAGGPIERLVSGGASVLAVDLRGCGETETPNWRYGAVARVVGHNGAEFFVAYLLGQSVVGLRVEDILSCVSYLRGEIPGVKPRLVGVGVNGVPALHAAALEPDLFGSLTLRESLGSWRRVVETPSVDRQLINLVHGALRTYDLPDLLETLPPGKVTVEAPLH